MGKPRASRRPLSPGDRAVLIALVVLAVLTGAVNALNLAGLRLVKGTVYVILPMLMLLVAAGWGLSAIVRRIGAMIVRRAAIAVAVVVMLVLTALATQYGALMAGLTLPQKYAAMTSPKGNRLIVMRVLDADQERVEARRAARLAANPDADPDYTADDWGYTYTAYGFGPMDLFYRPDTLIEGEVHIGYASSGELMLEWEEDETVGRFFIKNPETADAGEMRARVK